MYKFEANFVLFSFDATLEQSKLIVNFSPQLALCADTADALHCAHNT